MTVHIEAWEHPLLSRAYAAFHSPIGTWWEHPAAAVRDDAYRYCALVTRTSSRTFSLAASLLPLEKRRAVQALYAFCRATDDVVDRARTQADAARTLAGWRERLLEPALTYDPVPLAFRDAQVHHGIPQGYATQLIDGIARDLTQTRYASFAELAEYCYGVASTVGLMVMHVIRFRGEDALPYAIRLGVALQMTNILRDVGEDWRLGRCYLPLDELAAFGLTEDAIARGVVDDRWRTFMRFQIARARSLYQEAEPGIALRGATPSPPPPASTARFWRISRRTTLTSSIAGRMSADSARSAACPASGGAPRRSPRRAAVNTLARQFGSAQREEGTAWRRSVSLVVGLGG
jgi:15-cis-phytoene synthase